MFTVALPSRSSSAAVADLQRSIANTRLPEPVKRTMTALAAAAASGQLTDLQPQQATASSGQTGVPGGQNLSVSDMPVYLDVGMLLSGFFYAGRETAPSSALPIYFDIYSFDPVCGTAVDMLSMLPFTDGFTLEPGAGMSADELQVYADNVAGFDPDTNLSKLRRETLIAGRAASTLLFTTGDDNERPRLIDLLHYNPLTLTVKPSPLKSLPSIVKGELHQEYLQGLEAVRSGHAELFNLFRDMVGEDVVNALTSGQKELSPRNLLLLQNEMHPSSFGVSIYKRVLPMWFYEKNLFRGTLQESIRRHRGVTHIQLGDDTWQPRPEDFSAYASALQQAALDPVSALFMTRNGVTVSDIMEGGQFWKVDDLWQTSAAMKCKAMGIPEAITTMDGSFALEQGVATTLDLLREHRQQVTRQTFYDKILPMVGMVNGYVRDDAPAEVKELLDDGNESTTYLSFMMKYGRMASRYLKMPTVNYHRPLKAPADPAVYDALDKLAEKGVPIQLRMLAAAANVDLDKLLEKKPDDLALRKQMKDYKDEVDKLNPPPADGGFGGGGFESGGSGSTGYSRIRTKSNPRSFQATGGNLQPGEYTEHEGVLFRADHSGKPKIVADRHRAEKDVNMKIVNAFRGHRSRS